MEPRVFRQGDVILVQCDEDEVLPVFGGCEVKRTEDGALVLALGEVTGHKHAIFDESVSLFDYSGMQIVKAPEGATLVHEEHEAIVLPPGTYKRFMQWEYSPSALQQVYD